MAASRWRLKRNCSLTPRQAVGAWSLPGAVLLLIALLAALQGWWWILLFALTEIAALLLALCLYARHAGDGDTLVLEGGILHIEQRCGTRLRCTDWSASMVRLEACEGEPITLRAGRQELQVGAQVTPPLRDIAARELRSALRLDAALQGGSMR